MESGAKGCEVVVSGKLRGQRAKSMKFTDGLMIHSGDPRRHYVDSAVRHVPLRQGEWKAECSLNAPSSSSCNNNNVKLQCSGVCLYYCSVLDFGKDIYYSHVWE